MSDEQLVGAQRLDHLAPVGGMDYTDAPHLLAPRQWRLVKNARTYGGALRQVARRYSVVTLADTTEPVRNIVALPTGTAEYSYWIALQKTKAVQFVKSTTGHTVLSSALTSSDRLWGTYVHNNCLFFTNDSNRVRYCDGGAIRELWHGMHCRTMDATIDPDIYGTLDGAPDFPCGPFTREPFFTWDGTGYAPTGYFTSFNWTSGTVYRVYVASPQMFTPGATVSVWRGTQTLTGTVSRVESRYVTVLASNTVATVSNAVFGAPWSVRLTHVPGMPSGRYVTVFFDHVVVGAPPKNRHMVLWSHLYNYARWKPASDSEADSRVCTDYQRGDDVVTGVTGLQHFRDRLLIFTPSCIYVMTYTGLPRVVRVDPLVQDYGNGLPYATASLDDRVVWCDVHHRSFYAWRGQGVEDFGSPIAEWFFGRLSSNSELASKTLAQVDRANHEVSWLYCTTSATDYDEAVVYDWVNNTWHVQTLDGEEQCLGRLHKRAKTCGALTGTCAALTGTCDALEQTSDSSGAVYGAKSGVVLGESASSGDTTVTQEQLVFETGDLIYGSATTTKEVHTMVLQVSGTYTSVLIEVAARETLGSTVTYEQVGMWRSALPEKQLTFRSRVGKVLRYRFTVSAGARDFVFHGYTDNIVHAYALR